MAKKKKPGQIGRPKIAANLRKIGLSIKLRPATLAAVEKQRGQNSRSQAIEQAVEEKYLPCNFV